MINQYIKNIDLQLKLIEEVLSKQGKSFVAAAYNYVLRRSPDTTGIQHYLELMNNGVKKIKIICDLINSREHKNLYNYQLRTEDATKYTPSDFIIFAYRKILLRDPDSDGLAYYLNHTSDSISKQILIRDLENSDEAISIRDRKLFLEIIGKKFSIISATSFHLIYLYEIWTTFLRITGKETGARIYSFLLKHIRDDFYLNEAIELFPAKLNKRNPLVYQSWDILKLGESADLASFYNSNLSHSFFPSLREKEVINIEETYKLLTEAYNRRISNSFFD